MLTTLEAAILYDLQYPLYQCMKIAYKRYKIERPAIRVLILLDAFGGRNKPIYKASNILMTWISLTYATKMIRQLKDLNFIEKISFYEIQITPSGVAFLDEFTTQVEAMTIEYLKKINERRPYYQVKGRRANNKKA